MTQFFAAVNDFFCWKNLFYSFTGKSREDKMRNALVEQEIERLKKMAVLDEVSFGLYDAEKIIVACRAIKNRIKKDK